MTNQEPVVFLNLFTLLAVVAVAGGAFLYFLRSRHNRFLAERALLGDGGHHAGASPDGALPELVGIAGLAVLVMALLFLGVAGR